MPRITTLKATIENMQRYRDTGAFAFSPWTGEEYSANPLDYWNAAPGWLMTDSEGNAMELVIRQAELRPPTLN